MNIAVLGAGAWGSAIASSFAATKQHHVTLWGREADVIAQLQHHRINQRYLPDITLDASLRYNDDLDAVLSVSRRRFTSPHLAAIPTFPCRQCMQNDARNTQI